MTCRAQEAATLLVAILADANLIHESNIVSWTKLSRTEVGAHILSCCMKRMIVIKWFNRGPADDCHS